MTKTIMTVDDSPEILTLLSTIFKRKGYTVLEAESSEEALAMLAQSQADLFLLDVMMPEINGIELCKRIRALPEHHETPIVILSAYSESGIIEQAFAAGANDYLLKPIDPLTLEGKIKELVGTE